MTSVPNPLPPPTRPRPRPVRILGVLNVLFGAVLFSLAWLTINSMAFNGSGSDSTSALKRAVQEYDAQRHETLIGRLDALEAEAPTSEAREVYRSERLRLQEAGPTPNPQAQMVLLGDRMGALRIWSGVDSSTSIVLNLLLIVSGIGLIQRVEGGRRLALWIAGLKLVRLVVLQSVWLVFLVPTMSRVMGEMAEQSIAMQGGGLPPGMPNMTQLYLIIYTVFGVIMLTLGSIYPVVLLLGLTRPGVRAACAPAAVRAREALAEVDRA